MKLDPANLTAQLHYRAVGNPPSTLPDSAISNCYPGLEFDFRNIWRRMFEGIVMHEADNYVIEGEGDLAELVGHRLLMVEDAKIVTANTGPIFPGDSGGEPLPGSSGIETSVTAMEWSNALADVLRDNIGGEVLCHFTREKAKLPVAIPDDPSKMLAKSLRVNPLFAVSGDRDLAVIDERRVQPGELTMSLCSPWQNDYRECACYYWAASRPDYVNVDVTPSGVSTGSSWMARDPAAIGYVPDDRKDSRLLSYSDLFREWQQRLRFVVGGRDHP